MRTAPLPHTDSDKLISNPEAGLERLLEIMRRLREPEHGCPWDLEQTFETIAPYTIEEAYEVADAIQRKALDELPSELGDLLLQVVYHAQIGAESGDFSIEDVISAISEKMIRRHPHVFGDWAREDFVEGSWERLKDQEKGQSTDKSVLDDVPSNLPGLTRAVKLQKRAARIGFDWPDASGPLNKVVEETGELHEAIAGTDGDAVEDEFADLLFSVANLARHLSLDPEKSLRRANAKFERRFRYVEAGLMAQGRRPEDTSLEEMETLWGEAKARERTG